MKKEKTLSQLEKERKVDGIYMSPFKDKKEEETMKQIHGKLCDLFKMIKLVNEKGHNFCICLDGISVGLNIYKNEDKDISSNSFSSTITFHAPSKSKFNKEGEFKGPVGVRIRNNEI